MEEPTRRNDLLSIDSSSEDEDFENATSQPDTLNINSEYAKRYEHNQQRAERHRLEEKYGRELDSISGSGSGSDSDSESEDDEGELATTELDDQITATLNAIRSKDPRVYDPTAVFYDPETNATPSATSKSRDKSIHLRDYHRQNLLRDAETGISQDKEKAPTYVEEQSTLRQEFLDQVQSNDTAHRRLEDENEDDDDEDFLVKKPDEETNPVPPRTTQPRELDVAHADEDPEAFLSNLMASRAWVPTSESQLHPFESDDDDDDDRADAFEQAYNMRFEDPALANEKLVSHSREAAAKYSVRREEHKGRKRAREIEKATKDAAKQQRHEDKARLRRIKIEEAQAQWLRLKEAAGLKRKNISDEMLMKFLQKGFEEDGWDQEMATLLGDNYDAEQEDDSDGLQGDTEAKESHKKHLRKPKWSDDIDINDIVPDFDEEEERKRRELSLSDVEEIKGENVEEEINHIGVNLPKAGGEKGESLASNKRDARLARQKIETFVDSQLAASLEDNVEPSAKQTGLFRYRETSPTTYGLDARDILMATDSQLNQFAGLKKLAAFRDTDKKARDRRKLGKKARLREWRRETFGNADGASTSFEEFFNRSRGLQNVAGRSSQLSEKSSVQKMGHNLEPTTTTRKRKRKR